MSPNEHSVVYAHLYQIAGKWNSVDNIRMCNFHLNKLIISLILSVYFLQMLMMDHSPVHYKHCWIHEH